MLSPGRECCELTRSAEELRLPLGEDCSPPAQETRLRTSESDVGSWLQSVRCACWREPFLKRLHSDWRSASQAVRAVLASNRRLVNLLSVLEPE